jgi:DUF1680 family protein
VTLRVTAAARSASRLSIRVPAWADRVDVSLNGRPLPGTTDNGSWQTSQAWKPGDALTVRYVFRTRTVADPADATRLAIFHGPWLLGVDAHDSPSFFDEPSAENRIVLDKVSGAAIRLNGAPARAADARSFTAPVAHFRLRFLPGGYPVQPQSALLRPIAEQTSLPDATAWAFWFKAAK